ncbi:MAG TPA: SIR2 family protein [Candidatus Deferrimicrobium sp.]|nr:SIR2 family protein [Candidatus Deferrimicrobium sp.]
MKFGDVDIRDELIDAQKNNELVIFAGAGISKASPSNLPLFSEFADSVESTFDVERYKKDGTREIDERIDAYLSRVLQKRGSELRRFVQQIYGRNVPCNALHKDILRLFCPGQEVRVVTTNYDELFSRAAAEIHMAGVQHCYSPNLPVDPRRSFAGIANIHGTISKSADDLIVTAEDFSFAYLQPQAAWVTRFLAPLLEKFFVLFIGYSLNDVIVEYLLRGSSKARRYALCVENRRDMWDTASVTVIPYQESNGEDAHRYLREALKEWAIETQSSCKVQAAEKEDFIRAEQEIATVAAMDPMGVNESPKIILSALQDLPRMRFFTRHATDAGWLRWLDDRHVLDSLFDPLNKLTEVEDQLALWVAQRFAVAHYSRLLELVHQHRDILNPALWYAVVRQLTHDKERPHPTSLAVWVSILIKDVPAYAYRQHSLEYLLVKCRWPEDKYTILQLLSYLLTPIPVSEYSSSYIFSGSSEYKFEYRLTLRGDEYWLRQSWTSLRERVGEFWRYLLPTVQKYLSDAYHMNATFGKAAGDQDSQSWWRSAVEKHEQDEHSHRSFDVLIDAARDILVYLLKNEDVVQEGKSLVESWFATEVPLLRRIAIHGVAVGDCWSGDEKITWLLDKNLIYRHSFKHETFQVLRAALANCTDSVIQKLVDTVLTERATRVDSDESKRIREYEKYNLLLWMKRSAPESAIVRRAFQEIQDANPSFVPREYPDLDFWTTGAHRVEPVSPKKEADLRNMPSSELSELLATYKGDRPYDYDEERRGLLGELSMVVASSFDWSMRLAQRLIADGHLQGDVWYHLIKGWTQTPLSEPEWEKTIVFLSAHPEINRETQGACELLENAVKSEKQISDNVLSRLEDLSDVIWKELETLPPAELFGQSWLATAINHGAGKLGEFWLQALHQRFIRAGERWAGMPEEYKDRFEKVISSDSYAGQLGRCVLASRLHYLYLRSQDWSKKNLLPLLDFSISPDRATAAWHGFLVWGQVLPNLVNDLKPLYIQAVDQLSDTQERHREQLFSHVTDIMLDFPGDPPDWKWFYEILGQKNTSDKDRQQVIDRIWLRLRQEREGFKNAVWSNWLKRFWSDRADGVPVPLSVEEADRLIEWTPWLKPVFAEAVDLACRTLGFKLMHTHLYHELGESSLPSSHPKDVVRLLVYILGGSGNETLHGYELVPLYDHLAEFLDESELVELKNILKRLGVI